MFDRVFFERQFPDCAREFCRHHRIEAPVIELMLDDGSVLRVKSIGPAREQWLGLVAHSDGGRSTLILCPYFTIKRITFAAPSSSGDVVFTLPPAP
jgi:hypothetical protein